MYYMIHLYKAQEQDKLVYGNRNQRHGWLSGGELTKMDTKDLSGVMKIF